MESKTESKTANAPVTDPPPADVEDAKPSVGLDEAAKIFNGETGEIEVEFSEKEASKVRWKIDLIIVPMVRYTDPNILGLILMYV